MYAHGTHVYVYVYFLFMFYILVGKRSCPVVKLEKTLVTGTKAKENSPLGCIGGP